MARLNLRQKKLQNDLLRDAALLYYDRRPTTDDRRPTTVVDETHLAELALPINGSLKNKLKVIFRGGECAHIVHAEDVVEAAIFFSNRQITDPKKILFVSLDDQPYSYGCQLMAIASCIYNGSEQ